MDNDITAFVGLDVHKSSIAVAVAGPGRDAPRFVGTTGPQLAELLKALAHVGQPQHTLIAYEAGPCGYGLARELGERGYRCEVIAVAKMPRKPGERVKTDRRDALTLARYLRGAELTSVVIPDERDEAIRDLSRAREDAIRARLKARQQLKAMLLRHGYRYTGKSSWTAAHERYLARVRFDHPAQDIAYAEYRSAVREAHDRSERITAALREQVATWRWQSVVSALMTLRGVEFIATVTLVAELGDLTRFAHPKQLMSYLGLVPIDTRGPYQSLILPPPGIAPPPTSGTTMREAVSRRYSRASSMACSSAAWTAAGKRVSASSSVLASISKASGSTPPGVSSCVWPEYSTGREASAAPSAVTGIRRRSVPALRSVNTSSRYSPWRSTWMSGIPVSCAIVSPSMMIRAVQ
jgi:transposase